MSQTIRVVKQVDTVEPNRANIRVDDRALWIEMRQLLLQMNALIERRLGISRRCRSCGEDVSSR